MLGTSFKYCYNYTRFGAPLPGRTYQQGKFDAKVVNLSTGNITTTTGWTTIFCTNPTTCTSPETAVTLTATGGKLRMQTNKRYAQAYYTFTTVPGRVYKVKYRLSGVTFGLTNTSVFAPINRTELYTSANLQSSAINGADREMIFTATEASVRFYITRGWAPNATTASVEEVSLDYLNIAEVPSQVNTISCTSINENMVMLANSGVNTADMNAVTPYLNAYYNRTYTAAEYQAILSHCTGLPASYVLAKEGAEAANVKASYARGFNGMEKDDDTYGEGNAYDFGARIYDSRLGRWLSLDPMQHVYPSLSPYSAMGNSPLVVVDTDGRILRDSKGNILYTKNGDPTESKTVVQDNKTKDITITVTTTQNIIIYANDGTEINAIMHTVETTIIHEDGAREFSVDRTTNDSYDCHGLTFGNGLIWIDSKEVEKLMKGDGYKEAVGPSENVNCITPDNIILYKAVKDFEDKQGNKYKKGDVTHSAVVKEGKICSKNGNTAEESTTNNELERLYNSKGTIYKKQEDKVIDGIKSTRGDNGAGTNEITPKERAKLPTPSN